MTPRSRRLDLPSWQAWATDCRSELFPPWSPDALISKRGIDLADRSCRYLTLALAEYALGLPISCTVEGFTLCAQLFLAVQSKRGTERDGRVALQIPDDLTGFDIAAAFAGAVPCENTDFTLGNSWSAVEPIYAALICQRLDLAQALAKQVWDPPDATYVGPTSELCTRPQQAFAYGLRDCLLENKSPVFSGTERASCHLGTVLESQALLAIKQGDLEAFLVCLNGLVAEHARHADHAFDNVTFALSLSSQALAGYAIACGVATADDLRIASPYLSHELLTSPVL